jgi:hypothetical protein
MAISNIGSSANAALATAKQQRARKARISELRTME